MLQLQLPHLPKLKLLDSISPLQLTTFKLKPFHKTVFNPYLLFVDGDRVQGTFADGLHAHEDRLQADAAEAVGAVGHQRAGAGGVSAAAAAVEVRPVAVGQRGAAAPEAAGDDAALVALPLGGGALRELHRLGGHAGNDAT